MFERERHFLGLLYLIVIEPYPLEDSAVSFLKVLVGVVRPIGHSLSM